MYDFKVFTDAVEGSDTKAPIYVVIIGTDGKSAKKILSEKGFEKGSSVDVRVFAKDVG